jgi:hypothetical protein
MTSAEQPNEYFVRSMKHFNTTNVASEWLTLKFRVWEVTGLKLGPETSYRDCRFYHWFNKHVVNLKHELMHIILEKCLYYYAYYV